MAKVTAIEAIQRRCVKATKTAVSHLAGVLEAPDDAEALELTRKDKVAREFLRGYQAAERAAMNQKAGPKQIGVVIVPAQVASVEEWQARRRLRELEALDVEAKEPAK